MEQRALTIDNGEIDHEDLLRQVTQLVTDQRLLSGRAHLTDKIIQFQHPQELQDRVDFSLGEAVTSNKKLLEICQQAIDYSVHTNHPLFLNQLYHSVDPVGLAGTWLSEALNTNQHTFEVAPFFILVEHAVLSHLRSFAGWKDGDGIFSPGGSMSNMYGMVVARYSKFPQVKTGGMSTLGRLVVFTSEESHYSISKAAHWMGLGIENVIKIPTDEQGLLIPTELEKNIVRCREQQWIPYFVNATAGTTVLGAYDPLDSIADICSKYNLWLHVDACWGGAALLSKTYRSLLTGIERADSIAWNPHKMLGAPLQCSAFLLKHKDLLHKCNSASASYLFQPDKFYDVSYDTGDKSFQCGRKVDAFKLWLMWKARGDDGMQQLVDQAFKCSRYFAERIACRPGFRLVLKEINCTNVCFWYIPPRLRNQEESDEWWAQISKVAPLLKKMMVEKGSMMIGYQPLPNKKWVNFFRLVVQCQPSPTYQDMDFVIEEMDRMGQDL